MGITALTTALKNNDVLASLLLGTNSVGDEGAELLARYMAGRLTCSSLTPSPPRARLPAHPTHPRTLHELHI